MPWLVLYPACQLQRLTFSTRRTPPLIPQFRHNLDGEQEHDYPAREGQQQVFRVTFAGVRNSVRTLIGKQADALARKFHETHDMAVKEELERLLKEDGQLGKPWEFVAR